MKVFLTSDLHLECDTKTSDVKIPKCDLIILAGDISHMGHALKYASGLAQEHAVPVIFVPGNHEYYGKDYVEQTALAREFSAENVYVLMNDTVEFDGVRFIGSTLWSDFSAGAKNDQWTIMQNRKFAGNYINDFHVIKHSESNNRRLKPEFVRDLNYEAMRYFKQQLDQGFDGTTVVVTHFSPSITLEDPQFKGSPASPYFNANCDELIKEYEPDFWFFGHTHSSVEAVIGKTKIFANQYGYKHEWGKTGYREGLVIDVTK